MNRSTAHGTTTRALVHEAVLLPGLPEQLQHSRVAQARHGHRHPPRGLPFLPDLERRAPLGDHPRRDATGSSRGGDRRRLLAHAVASLGFPDPYLAGSFLAVLDGLVTVKIGAGADVRPGRRRHGSRLRAPGEEAKLIWLAKS